MILKTERISWSGLGIQEIEMTPDTRLDDVRPDMGRWHLNAYHPRYGENGTLVRVDVMWREYDDLNAAVFPDRLRSQTDEDLEVVHDTVKACLYAKGDVTTVVKLEKMIHRQHRPTLTADEVDAFGRLGGIFFGENVVAQNGTRLARAIVAAHDTYGD